MPLQRSSITPPFIDFVTKYAISIQGRGIPPTISNLTPETVEVPSFQRGIVWRREQVETLLESKAALFGTAILSGFPAAPYTLVDGLQRFATGTALLSKLYPEVLAGAPRNLTAAPYFSRLSSAARHFQPIFNYNSDILRTHPRRAIRDSYSGLESDVSSLVERELSGPINFAATMNSMFFEKQIAIDVYSGFQQRSELTNTFINLNSQGVDLSPVDLLRARLVDQSMTLHWQPANTEIMENDFTEVFEKPASRTTLKALGAQLDMAVENPNMITQVFPDWPHFNKPQVDELVSFIDSATIAATSGPFPYLQEIFECGGFPFAIALIYFYGRHLQDFGGANFSPTNLPDFAGGPINTTAECHLLLRAFYRRLIDGTIGRSGSVGEEMLRGRLATINDIADKVNPVGAGAMSQSPNIEWLRERLRIADKSRSERIFNACLLPLRGNRGGPFDPLRFGRGQLEWTVDGLIPKGAISSGVGHDEADRLPNFAILPNNVRKSVRANLCSVKLAPAGPYASVASPRHNYIDWLVGQHYASHHSGGNLDNQAFLVSNTQTPVGNDRIVWLATQLSLRL